MFKHHLQRGVIVAAGLLIAAPVASATESATQAIIAECAQGDAISPGHSAADLDAALRDLPADVAEYTDCPNQLILARSAVLNPDGSSTTPVFTPPDGKTWPRDDDATSGGQDAAGATETTIASPLPVAGVDTESDPDANPGREPQATEVPVGTKLGGLAAAGIVGASLLTLWRPAMLRRHEADEE